MIGRPNVGKSTLINRLLGEERVIAEDEPGTTRDSIYIPFTHATGQYTLVDTAGIRRKTRIKEELEKTSVVRTLKTIQAADIIIFIVDARTGVVDQDLHLLDYIVQAGKALIIALNKWDGIEKKERQYILSEMDRRLPFVDFVPKFFISALHGTGVGDLFKGVRKVSASAQIDLPTPQLTRLVLAAVAKHEPPYIAGRRIKLRYAHCGGHNPLTIVIHGKQLRSLSKDYQRYLINYLRKQLKIVGVPILLQLKDDRNPYNQDE
jgi:GTP-binding protein